MNSHALMCITLLLLATMVVACGAESTGNMIGRQSQNEGLTVVPAPGTVTIDGKLDDWDWSGRIWIFADSAVRSRYSVEAAGMWDTKYLYLAAKWKDPTPLFNQIDPAFNPNDGWKADAWQMRIQTDRTLWITTWQYTPRSQSVMHLDYWKELQNDRGEHEVVLLAAKGDSPDLGRDVQMAFRKDDDGKGFVQEVRIPWAVLYREAPEAKPGMTFRLGNEFLWGDPTGKTWPTHRYADNMQPGVTSREFYWTNWRAWGNATLVEKGNVPVRSYIDQAAKQQGTIPIRAEIPTDAARFTLVIEDQAGARIRNLAGDFDPELYTVKKDDKTRTVEVLWDGLDDWGKLASAGTYRVRGLAHQGLAAEYDMCFYNPGTPPWPTTAGNGAWGADHAAPLRVARTGERMTVSWAFAEGGSGIIGIGADGLKKWGEKRGAYALAADAKYVYAISSSWHSKGRLCRLSAVDGSYQPFVLDGKPRPFELSPVDLGIIQSSNEEKKHAADVEEGDLAKVSDEGEVVALAAGTGKVLLAMRNGKLAILDASSAKLLKLLDVPKVTDVALLNTNACRAIQDGRIIEVDLASGAIKPLATPELAKPIAIAVDADGNSVVVDGGPDSQVKAYTPDGKRAYTCGKKGGRPIRGTFDPQAMMRVTSVAVDAKGLIWVTENWNYPRRVSVWGRDGKLVRDYVGNTGYAGSGCLLHETDPGLAYVGPVELALDHAKRSWSVRRILWVPDESAGETFDADPLAHATCQQIDSAASGKPHHYFYRSSSGVNTAHIIYMERENGWQPVAAIGLVNSISGKVNRYPEKLIENPSGEFEGLSPYDGYFWNDANGDGKVQRSECVIVKSKGGRDRALQLESGWGTRIGADLSFYTRGLMHYKPIRFTEDGAPVYGPEGMARFGPEESGDVVAVADEKLLLCLSHNKYPARTTGMLGIDGETGSIRWSYPDLYPGVHGSHNATMPKPGLLIGPLKICGIAQVNETIGRVFVLRGNLGQDFFMTTDGLFVGALFQDGRLPGDSLPDKEESLIGMPMEGFTHGSEPFNGWFGKQSDGKIRELVGFPREAAMILEIKGLETIQRFVAPEVNVTAELLVKANEDNEARAKTDSQAKSYTIKRLQKAPTIDGQIKDWGDLPAMPIVCEGRPEKASARLACDEENLYVLFDVQDASPWKNEGKDFKRLFKTGDAVEVYLGPAQSEKKRSNPVVGDVRVVLSQLDGRPVAVLMRPVDPKATADSKHRYHSPVGDRDFDRVEVLATAVLSVQKRDGGYRVEAALPWSVLGFTPKSGLKLAGDVGVISSDAQGTINIARTCWSNPHTNLVSDLPQESWLYPAAWGTFTME